MTAQATQGVADGGQARVATLGIDHVVVVVRDLTAAVARYAAVLGPPSGVEGGVDVGYRRALFELGSSGQRIELCQPLDADEPGGQSQASRSFRRRLETLGEGVHNVALLVADVPAARAAAERAGTTVIASRHSESFFLHPRDMSGALLQLLAADSADRSG
ncbi:MAG: hypothetical protein JWM31_2885 [Solirubrobacterales bacterium]|jgi:catechol 2,3-dioxygenase-like lactoylglutathione lyase family enzyme|nr:hypothetical protein [Solirubrobacterales bacterium]